VRLVAAYRHALSCVPDESYLCAIRALCGAVAALDRATLTASLLAEDELSGADRDRTDDLRLAKPALSQLSYSPEKAKTHVVELLSPGHRAWVGELTLQ
jgi:hypothetical protein